MSRHVQLFTDLNCALASPEKHSRVGGQSGRSVGRDRADGQSAGAVGGRSDNGATDWRSVLHRHAEQIRQGRRAIDARRRRRLLGQALGPLADDALRIVEAYARGASRRGAARSRRPNSATGSVIILNGIEASLGPAQRPRRRCPAARDPERAVADPAPGARERRLSYAREQDLIELDRRILFLLQSPGRWCRPTSRARSGSTRRRSAVRSSGCSSCVWSSASRSARRCA